MNIQHFGYARLVYAVIPHGVDQATPLLYFWVGNPINDEVWLNCLFRPNLIGVVKAKTLNLCAFPLTTVACGKYTIVANQLRLQGMLTIN